MKAITSAGCTVPLLPLRDVVVFPHMVIPLFVGREKSILALEAAMGADKKILLVAQRNAADDDPGVKEIYAIGTLANVLQMLKLPDGTVKVLVEGGERAVIDNVVALEGYLIAHASPLRGEALADAEGDALVRSCMRLFEQYVNLGKKIPAEVLSALSGIDEAGRLADTIAAHMSLELARKQEILEIGSIADRVERLMGIMEGEMELFQVEKRIRGRVKKQMEKSQREYYLNEQMKAIQKELGELEDAPSELENLEKRIRSAGMARDAEAKALTEFNKLKMMSPMSAEASVVRGYLDWMVSVPWKKRTKLRNDLARAEKILEEDHHGLEEVKQRVLEYLAVQKRVGKSKGPVLCFVGPPGVGKTSLGESIARATNRQFVRMALGGVRDEAEIRGHRRTYIGSLPGKILQKLSKAGVRNPLFLLDEVDKMGMDHRGDPASALLEVLDPEQNHAFNDHYLEVDYDLSDVMFICTSNSMNIPPPLLDRMEVIRLSGYTEDEKNSIAERYLLPKQLKNAGLEAGELLIADGVILDIIRYYTRESGVRGLERQIAKICRKKVKQLSLGDSTTSATVTPATLEEYLGVRKYRYGEAPERNQIGQVTGLAWTQVGGELLPIEAVVVPGKGRQVKTGSLGDVMQESIQAAMTVVRARAKALGIKPDFHEKSDMHIHVPEGATPKDGPSAGIGMCTAMVSVLTGIPVRAEVAMTGEITLRGQVLAIGGLKEKLLAAHRGGIKIVVIPEENERDLKEIPENVKRDLEIRPVRWIEQVLDIALETTPKPLSDEEWKTLSEKAASEGARSPEDARVNTH
jgi:ATP-dependent Lon protease